MRDLSVTNNIKVESKDGVKLQNRLTVYKAANWRPHLVDSILTSDAFDMEFTCPSCNYMGFTKAYPFPPTFQNNAYWNVNWPLW